ncbi:MAG TPA: phage holin family protein [Euzebyales bacterium]|nr:phage holin family protein [Euzebyales bacterium]
MSATTPRDPYEPPEPDATLPELVSRLTDQSSTLFRQEIELAKNELKAEIHTAGRAGGLFGGAALVGFLAAVLLSFAAAWALGDLSFLTRRWGF